MMVVYLVVGGIFLLLILLCWIIYRRTQNYVQKSYTPRGEHASAPAYLEGVDEPSIFPEDVARGTFVSTDADSGLSPSDAEEDITQSMAGNGDWEWQDDQVVHESDHGSLPFSTESWDDPQSVESETVTWEDDESMQNGDELVEDGLEPSTETTDAYLEPQHHEHQDATVDESETVHDWESLLANPNDPSLQVTLPLGLTEAGTDMEKASERKPIEVDESIEFPLINGSNSQTIDMLGWVPGNGTAVSRTQLLALVRDFNVRIELPISIFAQLIDSDAWVNLMDDNVSARFSDLMLTMQLTHFGKSVDESNWWRFYDLGEYIAENLSRIFLPSLSLESALTYSKTLTEQVDNLNIQAVLILQSKDGRQLSERTLDYLAREYELVWRSDEEFEKIDPRSTTAVPMYVLTTVIPPPANTDHVVEETGLALYCNLPCVREPLVAFDQMVEFAHQLESRFPLTLVDEERNRIFSGEIQLIRSQLQDFIDDMEYCNIVPGSNTALRLFQAPNADATPSPMSELSQFVPIR